MGDLVTDGEFSGKYCIPVITGGKNLLNDSGWEQGQYRNAVWENSSSRVTSGWLPVFGGKSYTITINDGLQVGSFINVNFFDKDKKWLGNRITLGMPAFEDTSQKEIIPNLPEDARFLRAVVRKYTDDVNNFTVAQAKSLKVQVELGETDTKYEPYHEPVTTNIYLGQPLETGEILKFPENILVHADGMEENVIFPEIPTFEGTTVITADTEILPSNIEMTYKVRK